MSYHGIITLHIIFFKSAAVLLIDVKQTANNLTYILLPFIQVVFLVPIKNIPTFF